MEKEKYKGGKVTKKEKVNTVQYEQHVISALGVHTCEACGDVHEFNKWEIKAVIFPYLSDWDTKLKIHWDIDLKLRCLKCGAYRETPIKLFDIDDLLVYKQSMAELGVKYKVDKKRLRTLKRKYKKETRWEKL